MPSAAPSPMVRSVLLAAIALCLGSLPAAAQPADALPDPRDPGVKAEDRLEVLLERVRRAQEGLESLEARFVQRKESALLLEPAEAEGVFSYAAPDRVRWEYLAPDPITLLIRDDVMTTWYRDLDQAEKVHVGRHSQKILEYLGAGSSIDNLKSYFEVRLAISEDPERPFRLELQPRYERIAKRLEKMELWLDSESYLPVRLSYVESDGDVTEYRFEDLKINASIPGERFELQLPRDVDLREIDLSTRPALR